MNKVLVCPHCGGLECNRCEGGERIPVRVKRAEMARIRKVRVWARAVGRVVAYAERRAA